MSRRNDRRNTGFSRNGKVRKSARKRRDANEKRTGQRGNPTERDSRAALARQGLKRDSCGNITAAMIFIYPVAKLVIWNSARKKN